MITHFKLFEGKSKDYTELDLNQLYKSYFNCDLADGSPDYAEEEPNKFAYELSDFISVLNIKTRDKVVTFKCECGKEHGGLVTYANLDDMDIPYSINFEFFNQEPFDDPQHFPDTNYSVKIWNENSPEAKKWASVKTGKRFDL